MTRSSSSTAGGIFRPDIGDAIRKQIQEEVETIDVAERSRSVLAGKQILSQPRLAFPPKLIGHVPLIIPVDPGSSLDETASVVSNEETLALFGTEAAPDFSGVRATELDIYLLGEVYQYCVQYHTYVSSQLGVAESYLLARRAQLKFAQNRVKEAYILALTGQPHSMASHVKTWVDLEPLIQSLDGEVSLFSAVVSRLKIAADALNEYSKSFSREMTRRQVPGGGSYHMGSGGDTRMQGVHLLQHRANR